jgi:cyclopropane fatty-acyl-phospholipid synthase-like methyltransferase
MPEPIESIAERMRKDWDDRAKENARYYVNTATREWTDNEFFASGEATVREQILNDMTNVCQGAQPSAMHVLEIGCGAGRVTRALAAQFGRVTGVDISGEMVRQATLALADRPNAKAIQNNGRDLADVEGPVDFAFSTIVFQHIPSYEVIESYVREVHRLLRPGGLFKFQVQGAAVEMAAIEHDSWLGVPFSEERARQMAQDTGFEMRYGHGAGDQYYWLWFFKQ